MRLSGEVARIDRCNDRSGALLGLFGLPDIHSFHWHKGDVRDANEFENEVEIRRNEIGRFEITFRIPVCTIGNDDERALVFDKSREGLAVEIERLANPDDVVNPRLQSRDSYSILTMCSINYAAARNRKE